LFQSTTGLFQIIPDNPNSLKNKKNGCDRHPLSLSQYWYILVTVIVVTVVMSASMKTHQHCQVQIPLEMTMYFVWYRPCTDILVLLLGVVAREVESKMSMDVSVHKRTSVHFFYCVKV
jgi:hypothetical protein